MKDIQLTYTFKELPLHIEVITELCSVSAESPIQIYTEPLKIIKTMVCIVCSKSASCVYKCKLCNIFVQVICGHIKICCAASVKKNIDQKIKHDDAKKVLLAASNAKHLNVDEGDVKLK